MNKLDIKKILKTAQKGLSKHSPKILTGLGIAGMGTTVVLAVKATPKAMQLIEEKKREEKVDDLSPAVIIKTAYKPYIPAVILGVTSTICLIGANTVSTRRTAALATVYKVTENTLNEYKDKITEIVGEEKAKEIKQTVINEKHGLQPAAMTQVVLSDDNEVRIIDNSTGQEKVVNYNRIKEVENEINSMLIDDGYASTGDYYDLMGLESTSLGSKLGWRVENGKLRLETYPAVNKKGLPVLIVDFSIEPEYYFDYVAKR